MGTLITVGQDYPLFQGGTNQMMNQDGAVFEALEDNSGYILAVYLNQPHSQEISILRSEKILTRLLIQDNFILPMVQFGSTLMIFEISFDPTLYTDERVFQFQESNNTLMVVSIDSSNRKVVALRHANFPLKFIQHCSETWAKAFLENNYSEKYRNWYGGLQQHSIETLWEKATPTGTLGDSYNIDEITYSPTSQQYKK